MEELLRRLLNDLERIGESHEELFDTVCRERMSQAIFRGFLRDEPSFELFDDFGLYTKAANDSVRKALSDYIVDASAIARALSIEGFHARLSAFQNEHIKSDNEENFYDDFFGFWRSTDFDVSGNLLVK